MTATGATSTQHPTSDPTSDPTAGTTEASAADTPSAASASDPSEPSTTTASSASSEPSARDGQAIAAEAAETPAAPAVPASQPAPPKGLVGWLLSLPRYLFRARLGFLMGHRFLVLVSEGRKTGLRRETPLEVMHYDKARREAVVAAGWGRKTQWLHNVEAGLAREIWIGRERYVPAYRILDVDEAMDALRQYERHSGIPKQIVRRVLSWLLGWTYDGSAAARRRAVEQLPLVAFRRA